MSAVIRRGIMRFIRSLPLAALAVLRNQTGSGQRRRSTRLANGNLSQARPIFDGAGSSWFCEGIAQVSGYSAVCTAPAGVHSGILVATSVRSGKK